MKNNRTLFFLLTAFALSACAGGGAPLQHTITLVGNYEGAPATSMKVEHGKKAERPKDPSRSDFYFGAWYTRPDLKTMFDWDKVITEDHILYARWLKEETWSLVGTMNDWGEDSAEEWLLKTENGREYVITHEVTKDDEFKIRNDQLWDVQIGFTAVENCDPEHFAKAEEDHILALKTGTMTLTYNVLFEKIHLTLVVAS